MIIVNEKDRCCRVVPQANNRYTCGVLSHIFHKLREKCIY